MSIKLSKQMSDSDVEDIKAANVKNVGPIQVSNVAKDEFGLDIPTELVPLPSKGRIYPSDSPLYGQEALEGPVGLDPWGKSFSFLVKKNSDNKTGVVVLWSAGADSKLETTRDMVSEDHVNFKGDDFGKAYSFKL